MAFGFLRRKRQKESATRNTEPVRKSTSELGRELLAELKKESHLCNADKCLQLIAEGADVSQKDEYGALALHWAARLGNKALASALASSMLKARVKIDEKTTTEQKTPAEVAQKWERGEVFGIILAAEAAQKKLELEEGLAKIEAENAAKQEKLARERALAKQEKTLLLTKPSGFEIGGELLAELAKPLADCDVKKCLYLIIEGADIRRTDGSSKTALFWAAHSRQNEIGSALIRAGARFTEEDMNALTRAGELSQPSVASLIQKEARAAKEDYMKKQEFRAAEKEEVARWIASEDPAKLGQRLLKKIAKGDVENALALVNAGASLLERDLSSHLRPLVSAAYYGLTPVVAAIIEKGEDPDHATYGKYNAHYWARSKNRDDIVELLDKAHEKRKQEATGKLAGEFQAAQQIKEEKTTTAESAPPVKPTPGPQ